MAGERQIRRGRIELTHVESFIGKEGSEKREGKDRAALWEHRQTDRHTESERE